MNPADKTPAASPRAPRGRGASAHLGQVTADTRDGRCRAALRYHAQTQRQAPRGDTDEHAARRRASRTVARRRRRRARSRFRGRSHAHAACERSGRSARAARCAGGRRLQADDDRTRPRRADTRGLPARDRRRGRSGLPGAGSGSHRAAVAPRRSRERCRRLNRRRPRRDVPGEPGGIACAIGDREHEVVVSGSELGAATPCTTSPSPHVLDGRAVELRSTDAGSMPEPSSVTATEMLSTSPSPSVEPVRASACRIRGSLSGTAKRVLPTVRLPTASTVATRACGLRRAAAAGRAVARPRRQ